MRTRLVPFLLSILLGCASANMTKSPEPVKSAAQETISITEEQATLPVEEPPTATKHLQLSKTPQLQEMAKKKLQKRPSKKASGKSILIKVQENIPLTVNHPEHFYDLVWSKISITVGIPIQAKEGTTNVSDSIQSAAAYSVILKGEPADHFEITQAEQIVSAPTNEIKSSIVYFNVKPLHAGKKKLIYQVKVRNSVNDPGIGLPEIEREIIVEVNKQTTWIIVKKFGIYLLGLLGAAVTTLLGIVIKKKFDKAT